MAEVDVVIRVVRGTHWDSKLIEYRTWSWWSHIEACYPNGNPYRTFGAMLKGGVKFRWTGEDCYKDISAIEAWHIPCTQAQHDAFWKFLSEQDGKPYDWRAIAGFGFRRDWEAPDSWFCSELMMAALKAAGIWNPKGHVHLNRIDPNMAYMIMVSLPNVWLAPAIDN